LINEGRWGKIDFTRPAVLVPASKKFEATGSMREGCCFNRGETLLAFFVVKVGTGVGLRDASGLAFLVRTVGGVPSPRMDVAVRTTAKGGNLDQTLNAELLTLNAQVTGGATKTSYPL
jgi:hypothetical protein